MIEWLNAVYAWIPGVLPLACMEARFMQQALVALVLLAPAAAAMGVQVVNFRLAFFSDAISHSAFAGVALGLLFSVDPRLAMPVFGVLVGLGIMRMSRRGTLSTDTVVGVFFSCVVAFGLAVVSREPGLARDMQRFLYGDILTIGDREILGLAALFVALMILQTAAYNRLLYIGLEPMLAGAHRVKVAFYQYMFSFFLALIVILSVRAVGVLLVTALLIVPAAAARNLTRTAGGMFWWAVGIGVSSAIAGLLLSAQPWMRTATGATVILCAFAWFLISLGVSAIRGVKKT